MNQLYPPPPPNPSLTLPMVPSCDRNCNTEIQRGTLCLQHSNTHFLFSKSGLTVQHLHHPPVSTGLLLRVCVHGLRRREILLNGRSSASHLFYSTWSTVGSRPGALSQRLVVTSTRLNRSLTTSWNFLRRVTAKIYGAFITCLLAAGILSHHLNC